MTKKVYFSKENSRFAKRRVYFFIGTIAEFIKLAPIIKEFKKRNIKFKLITSGQNPIHLEDLVGYVGPIKTDIALKEKSAKSSMFLFAIWTIKSLISGIFILKNEFKSLNKKNSYFIVHGDTVSSLIGSLIAKLYGLKLVHIESGLRSYNPLEPFPEEICRVINMHLADILFCPNSWALNNIKKLSGVKVDTKQNTLIEIYHWAKKTKSNHNFRKKFKRYYILYIRRQEHIYFQKEWTQQIIKFILQNAPKNINCLSAINVLNTTLFPSIKIYSEEKLGKSFIMAPRLPYPNFTKLMSKAEFIVTDGCTNQEEAYYMGLPLLALRNCTERIEGLGENVVISKGDETVIKDFLKSYKNYERNPISLNKRPSKIIVDYLSKHEKVKIHMRH